MNYSSNPSMMTNLDQPRTQGALPVWIKVFTKPSVQTFVEITNHPEAKARAAYIWVFLAGTLTGLISSLARLVVMSTVMKQAGADLSQLPGLDTAFRFGGVLGVVCGAPLTGLFSLLGFIIGVGIIQATARFFGGQGSFDKLAYAFGAITVPFSLISTLVVPLNLIPFLALCTLPLLIGVGLYVLFLELTAIKAVHQCGWGEAAAILFLPVILIAMLCGVAFFGLMRMAGPSINDILHQMQRFQ